MIASWRSGARPPGRRWAGSTGIPSTTAANCGSDLYLLVQRLDEGPGRVHLDIHTDDLDAEVARLEKLGAERVQQVHGWWVMRDPAGLLFCVLPSQPGSLDDTNAHRWD